jgi:hypothetical protein
VSGRAGSWPGRGAVLGSTAMTATLNAVITATDSYWLRFVVGWGRAGLRAGVPREPLVGLRIT